jgi:hypothetical protein
MAAFIEILPIFDLAEQSKSVEEAYREAWQKLSQTLKALGDQRFQGEDLLRRALQQLAEARRLAAEEERVIEQMSSIIDRFVAKLASVPRSRAADLVLVHQRSEDARDASRHAMALRRGVMTHLERALSTLRQGRPGRYAVATDELRHMQELGKEYQLWLAEAERRWTDVANSLQVVAKQVGAR